MINDNKTSLVSNTVKWKMDDLQLSDTLLRYFSDVFLCCDEDKSGKASVTKTVELIKSGGVPEDVILQVVQLLDEHIYI